jgi:hypothetical protein
MRTAVDRIGAGKVRQVTHHRHILETGNDSFRFRASSAAAPKTRKEKSPA